LLLEFKELIEQLDLLSFKSKFFIIQVKNSNLGSGLDSNLVSAFLKVLSSSSLGSVLWLEPLSGFWQRLDGLELSVRLGPLL